MQKFSGGYILLARKILESEIMCKPPLYFKLWGWMLLQAKFKDKKSIVRGQFLTSIKEMQDAMSYNIGYRKQRPSIKQIRSIYESLTKGSMIDTTKVTGGLLITILNYSEYQDPKNYECHNEGVHEGNSRGTSYNKERKRKKERKIKPPIGNMEELNEYINKNIPQELQSCSIKIIEFFKYRQNKAKGKRYQTEKGINGLFRDLLNCKVAGYNLEICLDIAMERNWQTPSADYFKPEMFLNSKSKKTREEILKEHGLSD